MHRLPSVILVLFGILPIIAQSPHGDLLKIDCAQCHNSSSWSLDYKTLQFNHDDSTSYNLEGVHLQTNCTDCHTMVFNEAPTQCASCHNDVHSASVGNDCMRCHTPQSWVVDHIPELHEENGFALTGAHSSLNCVDCHTSDTDLIFDKIGNECINCHQDDYADTETPNHENVGYSTDCLECHSALSTSWSTVNFDHDDFPLTLGHEVEDCKRCHLTDAYADTASECASCHQDDYTTTTNPNHESAGFSTDCVACHTTDPDWVPARFDHEIFPLTLSHEIEDCKQCHLTDTYADTSSDCVSCHQDDYTTTTNPNHESAGFSTDCVACHTTDPDWVPATFDHEIFPLTLSHEIEDCKQCHLTDTYADTSSDCVSCHQDDYTTTTNPNHESAGFSTDCVACHTTDPDWVPATFDHSLFPLTLSHDIQDCTQCHDTGIYADASSECASCHQDDYNSTDNPDHQAAGFSNDCAACHTTNPDWVPATFDHEIFPLTLSHDIQDCTQCHDTGIYADASSECASCHQDDYNSTDNPDHQAAGFSNDCAACHTTNPDWVPATFDHEIFPLTLSHDIQDCAQCHDTGIYADASSECASCHQEDYNGTDNPDHQAAGFSTDCAACHTTNPDWVPATFDHEIFPLTLSHDIQDCTQCHDTGIYADASSECASCHQEDYNGTDNPDHQAAGFSTDCVACHTTNPDWVPATFDHEIFPLTLSHDIQDCTQCHDTGIYADASSECASCHQEDYNGTDNPDHQAAGFSNDCAACHTTNPDWVPATFDHEIFPLTLSHDIQDCAQCHDTGIYADASSECASCHQDDYNSTDNPDHQAAGFSNDCAACHTTNPDWVPATFDHEIFPLTLSHDIQDCTQCHDTGIYADASSECASCHQDDYNSTDNPDHQAAGFSNDCAACHTTNPDWVPATFDHEIFPLTLSHDIQDCAQCHDTGIYADASSECASCHQDDYNGTQDPNHQTADFSTDCIACHTTNPGWNPTSWNHDMFSLTLGHDIADCNMCHATDIYADTSSECVSCHQDDFNGTANPNHESARFSTDCAACHTTNPDWVPATFDHELFPLTLSHDIQDCAQCHLTDTYSETSSECVSCHQEDYNGTDIPDHQATDFSTDCVSCHTTNPDWNPTSWDHNDFYPLNGAHALISGDCAVCHNGDYNNTPNTCVGCHQNEYNNTTDPSHSNAQFTTDCIVCHSENSWTPTTFDHDGQYFPIYSGKHQDKWDQCMDCHTVTNNYAVFSCIQCHEHNNKTEVDNDHSEVGNYVYESFACFECHPTGDD